MIDKKKQLAKYAQLKQDILGDGIKEGKLESYKKLSASLFGRNSLVFDDYPKKLLINNISAVMFLWAEKGSFEIDPEIGLIPRSNTLIGEYVFAVFSHPNTIMIMGNYKKGVWNIFDTDFDTTWKSQTEINIMIMSPNQEPEVIRLERKENPQTPDCWIEYSPQNGLSFIVGTRE